jgi:apolipoprotein N-acyltransferase
VRPQADYRQSLDVLDFARRYRPDILTKSGLMAGLGETEDEVHAVLRDLRAPGPPCRHHRPVSAAHAPQPAGSRLHRAAAVRSRTAITACPSASKWSSAARWCAVPTWPTRSALGFAWLALGNAGITMPLPLRLAPFTGVYGLSFIFAVTAATLAVIILRRGRRQLYWLAVVPALLLLPDLPAPESGGATAVLAQPNMSEEEQWTPESSARVRDELVTRTLRSAIGSGAKLILWPEVPGPIYYYEDPVFREEAARLARRTQAYFLFGTVGQTPGGAPLNSAVMLKPDGDFEDRYDKINLVPFGEYVPPLFSWVNRITQQISDFVPGNRIVVFPIGEHKLGAFICYESAFPHEVRQFANGGAEVLVNLSNDGYFGHSAAREQHLEIARMRAVENRRWLLRPTNDGISAVVDPAGRLAMRLPMYRETQARATFEYHSEKTFYTIRGDWFAWSCLLASIAALIWSQRPHYKPAIRA